MTNLSNLKKDDFFIFNGYRYRMIGFDEPMMRNGTIVCLCQCWNFDTDKREWLNINKEVEKCDKMTDEEAISTIYKFVNNPLFAYKYIEAWELAIKALEFKARVKEIIGNIYSSYEDKYIDICNLIKESGDDEM